MSNVTFNPEDAVLEIPFRDNFKHALNASRLLRFGPVKPKQLFEVGDVVDAVTGRSFPRDVWILEDVGPDGDTHRLVRISFVGDRFTTQFQAETKPENVLARLKGGLLTFRKATDGKDRFENKKLPEVIELYNELDTAFAGSYEPLYCALREPRTLSIEVRFKDAEGEGANKDAAATNLYVLPHPTSGAQ